MSSNSLSLQDSTAPAVVRGTHAGVRAIWLKVIIRAVFDWVSYRDNLKLEKRKIAECAERWLFQPSTVMNGLPSLCEILDLDINFVRAWAKTVTKEQVAKIEHLDRSGGGHRGRAGVEVKLAEMYLEKGIPNSSVGDSEKRIV